MFFYTVNDMNSSSPQMLFFMKDYKNLSSLQEVELTSDPKLYLHSYLNHFSPLAHTLIAKSGYCRENK